MSNRLVISLNQNTAAAGKNLRAGQENAAACKEDRKSIFVGDTKLPENQQKTDARIMQRRRLVGEQAMKIIGDAWARDVKGAEAIDELWKSKNAKAEELGATQLKMQALDGQKAQLREEYGIASDSQEQKDLELLQKYQSNKNGASFDEFSREELERLGELQHTTRTEYQSRVLALNEAQDIYRISERQIKNEVVLLTQQITDSKIEQLKNRDMQKAKESAEELRAAAGDEIGAMLLADAREALDEKMQEVQEEAKERAEAKAERGESTPAAEKMEQQEIIEGASESDRLAAEQKQNRQSASAVEDAQRNIQRILKENNLINEDIKGLQIDLGF